MTIKRRCDFCHELYEGLHCPACEKKKSALYDLRRDALDKERKIYKTRIWEKCRRNVRLRYHDYDIWLLAIGIKVVCEKPYIHHIIPRDEAPDLTMDIDNLVTVSKDSHEEIHKWYRDGKMDEAVARIKKGILEYEKLNGD